MRRTAPPLSDDEIATAIKESLDRISMAIMAEIDNMHGLTNDPVQQMTIAPFLGLEMETLQQFRQRLANFYTSSPEGQLHLDGLYLQGKYLQNGGRYK